MKYRRGCKSCKRLKESCGGVEEGTIEEGSSDYKCKDYLKKGSKMRVKGFNKKAYIKKISKLTREELIEALATEAEFRTIYEKMSDKSTKIINDIKFTIASEGW